MSSIVLTTSTATNVVAALTEGTASLHRTRANGTTRNIPFYAVGTTVRQQAEQVATLREAGLGMAKIAAEMHMSIPTVRRMLNSLILSQALEAGNLDGITVVTEAPVVHEATVQFPTVGGKVFPTLTCTCGASEVHSSQEHFGWQRSKWTATLVAEHTA
jgi:hypothetical protein